MAEARVRFEEHVRDAIARLHPETKRKVRAAIDAIVDDPAAGEPLEQELTGYRKIALGAWRIVYREEGRRIQIHAIGRRATVYPDLIARLERRMEERRGRYRRRGTRRIGGPIRRPAGRSGRLGTARQDDVTARRSGPRGARARRGSR